MTEPVPDTSEALAAPAELVRALRGAVISDHLAAELVNGASALVRGYCGWYISEQTGVEWLLDGSGGRTLFLPTMQLNAVTSVEEDGVVLAAGDLEWSRGGMVRKRAGGSWTRRLSGVKVICDHGVPAAERVDVARVVISVAAKGYANPTSQTGAAAGIVNDTFGRDHGLASLSEREMAVLAAWRLR